MEFLNKIITAISMIWNGQTKKLVAAISDKYQENVDIPQNNFRRFLFAPIIILEEIHLLLDEHSLAYPLRGGGWQVVRLPSFSLGRRIPVITRSVLDTRHGSAKHTKLMRDMYSFDGFVTVEQDDIIVDVGAYIGTLSFCFAERSGSFVSIDPMAAISNHLIYNTQSYTNAIIVSKAAWKEKTKLEINRSLLPNENSILEPDQGDLNSSFTVDADTVPNLVRDLGIEHIDYLKIEAEGVEMEILEAALADEMEIEKIAVDCSAERDGNDVISGIGTILESYNYEWRTNQESLGWGSEIVFAKQEYSQ
ncbi:FkbM family methyltransferase [Haloarcula argentinensis]|nr:FkbM family methyltransferase [Haloarcula argentinensis]